MAMAALLGFSAACSTVKQAPRDGEASEAAQTDTVTVRKGQTPARIVLMYGVRPPLSESARQKRVERLERQRPDSLPPVAEKPVEEEEAPAGR